MASNHVIYDAKAGIWGPDTSTSVQANNAAIITITGMTPDLSPVVQVRLDMYSEWSDYTAIDSSVPRAIVQFPMPYMSSQVIGLSTACRAVCQRA